MATPLSFQYDDVGDILHIEKRPPYAQQQTEQLEFNILARLNPATREVEGVEILFFTKWLLKDRGPRNLTELFTRPLAA